MRLSREGSRLRRGGLPGGSPIASHEMLWAKAAGAIVGIATERTRDAAGAGPRPRPNIRVTSRDLATCVLTN